MTYEIGPGAPNQHWVDFWEAAALPLLPEAAFPDAEVARWEASETAAHFFLRSELDEAWRVIDAAKALPGDN